VNPILFDLEPPHPLAPALLRGLGADAGELTQRRFPDGESYLRVDSQVAGRQVLLLANLKQPDCKFLPLCFLTDTLRQLGADSVGLITPYLCYMRQDCRFQPGEAITSRTFARLLSGQISWLVTVDPHLHRVHDLAEIYSIPSRVIHGAPLLADYLGKRREPLLLVGPDEESEQWVGTIARLGGHPHVVGRKQRLGDREVRITLPDLAVFKQHTAVIVDDIIASGQTLLRCVDALRDAGISRIECAAIHGLFVDDIDQQLQARGIARLVTSNSIPHYSNEVDVSAEVIGAVRSLLTD